VREDEIGDTKCEELASSIKRWWCVSRRATADYQKGFLVTVI